MEFICVHLYMDMHYYEMQLNYAVKHINSIIYTYVVAGPNFINFNDLAS